MEEPGLPAAPNSGLGSGPCITTRQESADASAVIGWCLAEWPAVAVEPWGGLTNQHPEDPNGAAMVTWIPSINPSHVSIFYQHHGSVMGHGIRPSMLQVVVQVGASGA